MTIGIYLGAPKNTEKVYIGQSNNIEQRIVRHNADLRKKQHSSSKIQKAYEEYGEFDWEILEVCTLDKLDDREAYYINTFNATVDGFNTYKDAYETPPAYKGIQNGNVRLDDIPIYLSIMETTLRNPTYSINKVTELVGCSKHIVDHLWNGGYTWLSDMYPEQYAAIKALSGTRQIGGKSLIQQGKDPVELVSPDLDIYLVDNIRKFARDHSLDCGDLNTLINKKVGSTKKWIVKDLDITDPNIHAKFYNTNRGYYKKQFDLYKSKS